MATIKAGFVSCPSNRLESPVELMVEAPGEKEEPVLALGRALGWPGRAANFVQSSFCLRFLVEPTWTMCSHPNRKQEM